jgi:hypothetical protein
MTLPAASPLCTVWLRTREDEFVLSATEDAALVAEKRDEFVVAVSVPKRLLLFN